MESDQKCNVAPAMPFASASVNTTNQPAPASTATNEPQGIPTPVTSTPPTVPTKSAANTVKQARKAFLLILQVSGAYWMAQFPAMFMRMIIFNMGFTWEDLDSRQYLVPAILVRLATWLFVPIVTVIHPIFYYYSSKELRLAFIHLVCRKN